jgi:hypothetical protein
MIQLSVVVRPTFVGSVDMLKITAKRVAKIVFGTAHGNRKVTDRQIAVSSVEAKHGELNVKDVMFVVSVQPDIAHATTLEVARTELKDIFDAAVMQVHPELRFVTLLSFNLDCEAYKRRPSRRYPFMDEAAQQLLDAEIRRLRDHLRKPA